MDHTRLFLVIYISAIVYSAYGYGASRQSQRHYADVDYHDDTYQFYHREAVIDPRYNVPKSGSNFMCFYFGICAVTGGFGLMKFNPLFEWKSLEWEYPTEADRQAAIANGNLIPGTGFPIDVDVHYGGDGSKKIFVVAPRTQPGIPASVNVITGNERDGNPTIRAYPDYSWYENPQQCKKNRIVSSYRVQIDECGIMWILDTGRYIDKIICAPQLLAFDLKTNKLKHQWAMPESLYESRSILVTPIVDNRNPQCTDTFVYVADCQTYSIIVYDVKNNRGWKATDKSMYPYPNYGTYEIQGESFELMDGVLGMTLEPYRAGYERRLFYHALTSPTENWVQTSFLRNESLLADNPTGFPEMFYTYEGTRQSQSAAEAFDKNGIQFFGQAHENTINCWDSDTQYGGGNIDTVEYNPQTLQFNSGMKIVTNPRGQEEIFIVTNRLQKIFKGTLNTAEVNFRILAAKTEDVLSDTKCRKRGRPLPGNSSYKPRPKPGKGKGNQ